MNIIVSDNEIDVGVAAAKHAAQSIRRALSHEEFVNIVVATGASQIEMFKTLTKEPDMNWSRVRLFHLDEYLDLPQTHPASFRKYLSDRFINQISPLKETHLIQGDAENPEEECDRLNKMISQYQIDVALVGIGENTHLAFNDPPADFDTLTPYMIVDLDTACRQQQLNEGWFPTFDEVPKQAITMSVQQILKAKAIVCTVPGQQKAEAVYQALNSDITSKIPASILRQHPNVNLYLDVHSANGITSGLWI